MKNYIPTKIEIERDISELQDLIVYSDKIKDNESKIDFLLFDIKSNIQARIQVEKGE